MSVLSRSRLATSMVRASRRSSAPESATAASESRSASMARRSAGSWADSRRGGPTDRKANSSKPRDGVMANPLYAVRTAAPREDPRAAQRGPQPQREQARRHAADAERLGQRPGAPARRRAHRQHGVREAAPPRSPRIPEHAAQKLVRPPGRSLLLAAAHDCGRQRAVIRSDRQRRRHEVAETQRRRAADFVTSRAADAYRGERLRGVGADVLALGFPREPDTVD